VGRHNVICSERDDVHKGSRGNRRIERGNKDCEPTIVTSIIEVACIETRLPIYQSIGVMRTGAGSRRVTIVQSRVDKKPVRKYVRITRHEGEVVAGNHRDIEGHPGLVVIGDVINTSCGKINYIGLVPGWRGNKKLAGRRGDKNVESSSIG